MSLSPAFPPPPPGHPSTPPAPAHMPAPAALPGPAQAPEAAPGPVSAGGGGPVIDFGGIAAAVARRWYLPLLGLLLAGAAAVLYLRRVPMMYTSRAEVAVEQQRTTAMGAEAFQPEDLSTLEALKSVERRVTSAAVLLHVARELKLFEDPTFAPARPASSPYHEDEMVAILGRNVTAALERGTRHIVVTVDDTDPKRARDICAGIVAEAGRQSGQATTAAAAAAKSTLEEEKARAEAKMELSQKAVDDFRRRFPSLPLDEVRNGMKTNSIDEAIRGLVGAVGAAEADVLKETSGVALLSAAGDDVNALLETPNISSSPEVVAAKRTLAMRQGEFRAADDEYGPKHPQHQIAVKQLAEAKADLSRVVLQLKSSLISRLAKVKEDQAKLAESLEKRKAEAVRFQEVSGEFAKLVSALDADRENHTRLLTRLKEAETNMALGSSDLNVVDQPMVPTWPSKPRKSLITGAAGAFGFGLGGALALLLHFMDRSVRGIQAGEELLRLPGLAALPEESVHSLKDALMHDRAAGDRQREAFRSLRTSLSILGRGASARTYLFTSARPGEGKSYTAMNFAVSLAQQGYRTLIIEANLRTPSLDMVFFGKRNPSGLADHLTGQGTRDSKACRQTPVPNLFLFSAGQSDRHPAEVLHEQAFAALLKDARNWFHKIVIDTPAIGRHTDALPLARHVDTVCLVVKAGSTPRGEAVRSSNRLAMAGAKPAGFVLNSATREALRGGFVGDFAAGYTAPPARALPPSTGRN